MEITGVKKLDRDINDVNRLLTKIDRIEIPSDVSELITDIGLVKQKNIEQDNSINKINEQLGDIVFDDKTIAKKDGVYVATDYTIAGELVVVDNSTAKITNATEYTKIKESKILFEGNARISFDAKNTVDDGETYYRIYKNGMPIGTERNIPQYSGIQYITFTEDFTGLKYGDLIQIYAKTRWTSSSAYCLNFKIKIGNAKGGISIL